MRRQLKYILIIGLVLLLFLIRAYEKKLFYDPLIVYFQNDYLYTTIPEINIWKLVVDLLFRFVLNSLITLAIIYLFFNEIKFVKFTGFFLMTSFIVLIVVFVVLLRAQFEQGYLFPFYIRRFLVHPLFLLILFPALYYYKTKK
ncbi:MAG: exosortase F system-associated protein [Flavobacteriaceae bacterium]|nr:exosortase F system-associated protein [Flavobacteriaceae bacterium]